MVGHRQKSILGYTMCVFMLLALLKLSDCISINTAPCSFNNKCQCASHGSDTYLSCSWTSLPHSSPDPNETQYIKESTHVHLQGVTGSLTFSKLKVLFLDDTSWFPEGPIKDLTVLFIRDVQWESQHTKWLSHMTSLEHISFKEIRIPDIHHCKNIFNTFSNFSELISLSIRNIRTGSSTILDPTSPSCYPDNDLPVKHLGLSQNPISSISRKYISRFPHLQTLNLSITNLGWLFEYNITDHVSRMGWLSQLIPECSNNKDIFKCLEHFNFVVPWMKAEQEFLLINLCHNATMPSNEDSSLTMGGLMLFGGHSRDVFHGLPEADKDFYRYHFTHEQKQPEFIQETQHSINNQAVNVIEMRRAYNIPSYHNKSRHNMIRNIGYIHPSMRIVSKIMKNQQMSPGRQLSKVSGQGKSHMQVFDLTVIHLLSPSKMHVIDLSNSDIETINIHFAHQTQVKLLNISYNKIAHITTEMQAEIDRIAKRYLQTGNTSMILDLKDNPLQCNCEDLEFVIWFQQSSFIKDRYCFTCPHTFKGITFNIMSLDVDQLGPQCFPSNTRIIIIWVVTLISGFLLVALGIVLYCKRWKLRYWWYWYRRTPRKLREDIYAREYEYDAFVAYNFDDASWVRDPLRKEMEENRGLKLCIHERDFRVGETIEDNILENVKKSRKALILLSPSFVESNWCQFELQMARCRLFDEGVDIIVMVILKQPQADTLNKTLLQIMKEKTYLEWTEDIQGQELFWVKLADALAKSECDCRPFD